MRHTICLCAFALTLCFVFSCSKTGIKPHPRRPGDTNLNISLIVPNVDSTAAANGFELIVSEPGGKVLLDSIEPFNRQIVAKLKTSQPLVDVTTVFGSGSNYSIDIYKSVKPEEWMTLPNDAIFPASPDPVASTITYTNVPQTGQQDLHFGSFFTNGGNGTTINSAPNNQLIVNYDGIAGDNVALLLFPALGLYSYQPVHSNNETISLAQMDTTVKVFFDYPSEYTLAATTIQGYLDTTDLTKGLYLYNNSERLPQGDLQYPPHTGVPAQKYFFQVEANSPDNAFYAYQTFGAPPTGTVSIPFPTAPIYTLNSAANDSFSVSFNQRPTEYGGNWVSGDFNIGLSITASPDSTLTRPVPFLNNLHSKLLQGQNFSDLTLQSFSYQDIPGLSYENYFIHQTDAAQIVKNPFPVSQLYIKFQ